MYPGHSPGTAACKHLGPAARAGEGPEHISHISQVEMQRCRGQGGLCSCPASCRSLPREEFKVLHWGTNNFKQINPSGFVLADRQWSRSRVPPSLSLLGSSFEHLQHQSTGPDLLDKPDFIIFLKGGYYLLPPKERGRGESH